MESESSRILSEEHQNILKVIDYLLEECNFIEKGKDIDINLWKNIVNFIINYADKFHHAKEEDLLFVEFCKIVDSGNAEIHCNPVEQMLVEHGEGRNYVRGIIEALERKDREKLVENARAYSNLLQEHIFKEDNILYPMTDDFLSEDIKDAMLTKFRQIEIQKKNEQEMYLDFVKSLVKQ